VPSINERQLAVSRKSGKVQTVHEKIFSGAATQLGAIGDDKDRIG
jgi:hypothetical protein